MIKIVGEELIVNLYDLVLEHASGADVLRLAEVLSCKDEIIEFVMQQVFEGLTTNRWAGSMRINDDAQALSPLEQFRRRVAKESPDLARDEIERLERKNKTLLKRIENLEKELRSHGR